MCEIDIISDLHLTHFRDHGSEFLASWLPEGEILIVAGDVGEYHWWLRGLEHIRTLCSKYKHVLFVSGNHEYYGTTLEAGGLRFREIERQVDNFYFLENDVLEIEGIKFAGCTLWFRKDLGSRRFEQWFNDFHLIHCMHPDAFIRNRESREFLEGLSDIDVVITHHLPSQLSVHEKYVGDPLNPFFVCDVGHVIEELQPKLWVHGHTHMPADYMIGKTRVITNPLGYRNERGFPSHKYRQVTVEMHP